MFERVAGQVDAVETAIGHLPTPAGLDTDGLDVDADDLAEILSVDVEGWRAAIPQIEQHYAQFGDRLPDQLRDELSSLEKRLASSG